jgi:hypothetical protein
MNKPQVHFLAFAFPTYICGYVDAVKLVSILNANEYLSVRLYTLVVQWRRKSRVRFPGLGFAFSVAHLGTSAYIEIYIKYIEI